MAKQKHFYEELYSLQSSLRISSRLLHIYRPKIIETVITCSFFNNNQSWQKHLQKNGKIFQYCKYFLKNPKYLRKNDKIFQYCKYFLKNPKYLRKTAKYFNIVNISLKPPNIYVFNIRGMGKIFTQKPKILIYLTLRA